MSFIGKTNNNNLLTISWQDNDDGSALIKLIDQTKLPENLEYIICTNYYEVADAIKNLSIRGAPAIGVAGAMGLALCIINYKSDNREELLSELNQAYNILLKTRPTAVNLKWGLDKVVEESLKFGTVEEIKHNIVNIVKKMSEDDINSNRSMGHFGSQLINDGDKIMTHCNAGALATVSYGTALGVIRSAKEDGKKISIFATETRPVMQGSRLTAFELVHDKIDVSLVPDTAVGYIMINKMVDKVIVGADRILKIGGKRIAPESVKVINPAFDLTPPNLVAGIITEKGIIFPPFEKNIPAMFEIK